MADSEDQLVRSSSELTRGDLLKRGAAAAFSVGMFGGLTPRERVRAADQGWTLTEALLYSEGRLFGPVDVEVPA